MDDWAGFRNAKKKAREPKDWFEFCKLIQLDYETAICCDLSLYVPKGGEIQFSGNGAR
jgi:hypothetical protein